MKIIISIAAIILWGHIAFGQENGTLELLQEGVALHDKGEYEMAIKKYEEVLAIDSSNVLALYEMSYSQFALGNYDEAVVLSQKSIRMDPDPQLLKQIYTTYANALDRMGKSKTAIKVYDAAIEDFPEYYHLYFNKGITLFSLEKYREAKTCFQISMTLNPEHAGSHNAMGRLLLMEENNIPALMALCRFMVIEPEGSRAKGNLPFIEEIMTGNVERTGKNSVSISIDEKMLDDIENSGDKEDDFSSIEFLLTLTAALDLDKKNKKKSERQRFQEKFESVCDMMKESQGDNSGFLWEYYTPYFLVIREHDLTETLSYLVFASSEDKDVLKWLGSHRDELDTFYGWSNSYVWEP